MAPVYLGLHDAVEHTSAEHHVRASGRVVNTNQPD
jgi:hypothetical protein